MSENAQDPSGPSIAEYVRALLAYRRFIVQTTVLLVLVVAAWGAWEYVTQPRRWSAWLEFRPTFRGADVGNYPNAVKFAPTDITDATVVNEVYDADHFDDLCSRDDFRSSFVVQQASAALRFLELEYQNKLADPRLSSVERQRLQDEYVAKRGTLGVQYRLTFVRPPGCPRIVSTLAAKAMSDVLQTWASDSDTRRGVLNYRVAVLTPDVFEFRLLGHESDSLLVRADLIRSAITRLIANIQEVEQLPGSETVRLKGSRVSFAEIEARFSDLVQAQLDPLVAVAGAGLVRESIQWVQESLHVAQMQRDAAQQKSDDVLVALREYSGTSSGAVPSSPSSGSHGQSDVQTVTPQLDKTFIDKIVELSAANTLYRQQLTKQLIDASQDAVKYKTVVQHYQSLLDTLNHGSIGPTLSSADVSRRLDAIVDDAKKSTAQFDALYDEFTRVSLRPAAGMYRIEQPVQTEVIETFSIRNYAILVLGILVISPIVLGLLCLVTFRVRQLFSDPRSV